MDVEAEISQVIKEIGQIKAQYDREVHHAHRPWPESLKTRVRKLHGLGLRHKEISQKTGVSRYTLGNWLPGCRSRGRLLRMQAELEDGEFRAIEVRDEQQTPAPTLADEKCATVTESVTVAKNAGEDASLLRALRVTVLLPGGARIEGVTPEFLTAWLGRGVSS